MPPRAALLAPNDPTRPGALALLTESATGPIAEVETTVVPLDTGAPVREHHLRVALPGPDEWAAVADVLVQTVPGEPGPRLAELVARHPGALVVAVRARTGSLVRIGGSEPTVLSVNIGEGTPAWSMWASLIHAWLAAGVPSAVLATAAVRRVRLRAARSHLLPPSRR
ncbi:hypothetical protein GCM10012280_51530 [Wenjunlia tyrosinilytica]|uniref:Uncharacterized protein n=1 Tax=Wenjunlia tyrosinilytica TaxID=1544741 RepID=A0A917ZTX5_9ACTN|nr:hypothetical protein GCM10012280_51530 [Wenjunlia tyrosinilytica]